MTTWPRAHGAAVLQAGIRHAPEHFQVDEVDSFDASGAGEHLLLRVRKTGMNTAFAAKRIAQWAGVPESAIGHAGLKDRHAITTQRFSVWLPKRGAPDVDALQCDDLQVLSADWHARKLPRGALAGNRFAIRLQLRDGDRAAIDARLQAIAANGVPNYFGEQRFGHHGGNIDRVLRWFGAQEQGRRGPQLRREQRSLLLSAARSALFNTVLAERVRAGNWDLPLDGEVWMLAGSHSVFGPEPFTPQLQQRLDAFDIHPTAPLWGAGDLRSTEAARDLERSALDDATSHRLRDGLERAGLRQERRATRLCSGELQWQWLDAAGLQLQFTLPPGAYATTVLGELGEITDAASPV